MLVCETTLDARVDGKYVGVEIVGTQVLNKFYKYKR